MKFEIEEKDISPLLLHIKGKDSNPSLFKLIKKEYKGT